MIQLLPISQDFRVTRTEWSGNTAFNRIGLQWAVGRTSFNEYSKKILKGLFDGARLGLTIKNTDISFALGYTGITYKHDAKIRIDQDDIDRMDDTNKVLAPQRLFLLLSSSFQEVIPSHTFGIDVLGQFDLLKQTGRTHTQYLIPYIQGRIGKNVNWRYWGVILFGEDTQFFYSFASGLAIQYFNPDWRYFTLTGKLDWAAGDYDGTKKMRAFVPITDIKQTVISNGLVNRFSNTLAGALTASVQPIQELLAQLSYVMLASPKTLEILTYTGSELSAKVAYHFYNDFDVAFTGGVFIPNKKIFGFGDILKLIEILSRRPQLQERLTEEIAKYIYEILNCQGVYVVVEAKHLCMTMRGQKKENTKILTTSAKGIFETDINKKLEVLTLLK